MSSLQLRTACGAPILLQFVNTNLLAVAFLRATYHHPPDFACFASLRLPSEILLNVFALQFGAIFLCCPLHALVFALACGISVACTVGRTWFV